MTRKAEILERAETYRDMARKSFDPSLRIEFIERAERYEVAAHAVKPKPEPHRQKTHWALSGALHGYPPCF